KHQDSFKSILKSPGYEGLLKHQDSFKSILKSPGYEGLLKHQDSLKSILKSPGYEGLLKHQDSFKSILKSPGYEGLLKHQDSFKSILKSPAYKGLLKYQDSFKGILKSPAYEGLLMQQETRNSILKSSLNIGVKGHKGILDKTLSLENANIKIFNEMLNELEEVYEEIEDKDLKSFDIDDKNEEDALKQHLFEFITYCKHLMSLINTVDSKIVWDILTKISVIVTLFSPIVNFGDEESNKVININGNNMEINLDAEEVNVIIINQKNEKSDVLVEEEGKKHDEKIKSFEKLDASAGERT
ncbi:hypothetical protein ACFVSW_26220, partial [Neobacillus sp. NPDC058068]|uniref:hypothetical protein n=1 Tax=Neobacillus sp. NPDC058068 TaxID=3346325 RepID=UPI0036D7D8CC